MLTKNMTERLNYQMNREIYSGYLYLGMAAYAASAGLKGFANWFNAQFKEELAHAERIFNYINQRGAKVTLKDIEKPPQKFSSGIDLFRRTLEHEKKVTRMINDLVDLAKSENDIKTVDFLQWFVKEQAEEEATPAGILQKLNQLGNDKGGLLEVDTQLATRG